MSAQTIFEQLRKAGCTVTGALALMGNWECESNLEACRVQGDFTSGREKSRYYAARIDGGDESVIYDGKGWGLAQWTYHTRKSALIQFCRRKGVSVADEAAQVDFAVSEMQTGYKTLWADLTTCNEEDLYKATELVCRQYEAPAYCNVQARYSAALKLKNELQAKAAEEIDNGVDVYWPPRVLCLDMTGPDVALLQALLQCHGYLVGGCSGIFNSTTLVKVMSFQADNGLAIDGIAGPKTFKALGVTT